jgi:hypothetical protein
VAPYPIWTFPNFQNFVEILANECFSMVSMTLAIKKKYFEFSFELSSVYFTLGRILAYFSFSGLEKLVLEARGQQNYCW